jgi:hypothetical protein
MFWRLRGVGLGAMVVDDGLVVKLGGFRQRKMKAIRMFGCGGWEVKVVSVDGGSKARP